MDMYRIALKHGASKKEKEKEVKTEADLFTEEFNKLKQKFDL